MHSNSPTPSKKARIEIIPLIDIMFFLLASFMLVSLSLVKLQGAKVDLPVAGKPFAVDIQKPDFTTVSLEKSGNIFWTKNNAKEKEQISIDEVGKRSRALYSSSKAAGVDAKVYINADKDVPYGDVLGVMDKLRRAGLLKVTFAVKAPPAGGTAAAPATGP